MRTKFRAWSKIHNKMAEVETLYLAIGKVKIAFPQSINGQPVHPLTYTVKLSDVELLQFTGLLDKNKVEIYEGDIISYADKNWIVYYDTDKLAFRFKAFMNFGMTDDDFAIKEHFEVIGNIHDELVEDL